MSYKAKINGQTFFDTDLNSEKYKLTSAQVVIPESFTFTIPPQNIKYDSINKLIDIIDVYRDNELIFTCRVYSITELYDGQKRVVCESIANVLYDSIHEPITYENTNNINVFKALIANHNSQVENAKKINIGTINVASKTCYRAYETIAKTSERINALVEDYGGRVVVRKESNGLYVDWLNGYDGVNQTVDFGKNLLDITISQDVSDVVTVLLPLGATLDDGNRLQGNLVYASQANLNKYGYIVGTKTWDDVTTTSALATKAAEYISAVCTERKTINVTAVDLADAGYDVESFRVGQNIKVHSDRHNINEFFKCTRQTLDLLNLANNKLTLGGETANYIKSNKSSSESQKVLIEKIIKSYAPKSAVESAIVSATSLITGNSGGNVILHDSDNDGEPDEILFLDTNSIDTAQSVWRWNMGGLGYSSTGYSGPYSTAITQDGSIVANMITAGEMSADRIKAGILRAQQGDTYWNLNTGQFHFGSDYDTDKSKNFTYQPVPPYYVGDLWVTNQETSTAVAGYAVAGQAIAGKEGFLNEGGTILVCVRTKQEGTYDSSDWVLLTNYIDTEELNNFEEQVKKASATVIATKTLVDTKLDASFATDQLIVNTTVQQTLDSHAGLIEQKASKEVVEGLNKTVGNVSAKFDADGALIELKGTRTEIENEISEKSKIYRQTPTAPYNIGDLWITTSADSMSAYAGKAVAGRAIAGFGNDIYVSSIYRSEEEAFEFTDWKKASDYVSDDQLKYAEKRIKNAEVKIDAANAAIALKADNTVVNDLGTRMTTAGLKIDALTGNVGSFVYSRDFNGDVFATAINQSSTKIDMYANEIKLSTSDARTIAKKLADIDDDVSDKLDSDDVTCEFVVSKIDGGSAKIKAKNIEITGDDITIGTGSSKTISSAIGDKVNTNDYTAEIIINKINDGSVKINAGKINLNGAVTANEFFKINTDGSVVIKGGSIDIDTESCTTDKIQLKYGNYYSRMSPERFLVNDINSYQTQMQAACMFVKKADKFVSYLGTSAQYSSGLLTLYDNNGNATIQLQGSNGSISIPNGLFVSVKKTFTAKLAADASAQYYVEGAVDVSPEDGYEIVGLGGFYAKVANTASNASCINVYRACYYAGKFYYGFCNTGEHDQDVTLYYYLLEARIKGAMRIIT